MDRKGQGNFRGKNHHVAGLTEPGNPRHPQRPPTGMIKGQLSNRLSNLCVLCVLCANPFRAGESSRRNYWTGEGTKGQVLFRPHPLPIRAHSWLKILHPSLKTLAFKLNHERHEFSRIGRKLKGQIKMPLLTWLRRVTGNFRKFAGQLGIPTLWKI